MMLGLVSILLVLALFTTLGFAFAWLVQAMSEFPQEQPAQQFAYITKPAPAKTIYAVDA